MKPLFLVLATAVLLQAPSSAELIRIEYEAEVKTVTGNPFAGLAPRGTIVTGYFVYDTLVPNTWTFTTTRGEYVHSGTGAFEAVFPTMTISGSNSHTVVITDTSSADNFSIVDGKRPVGAQGGVMKVDGNADEDVQLGLTISPSGSIWSSNVLPNPFPFESTDSEYSYSHTFTLADSQNDHLSLQFIRVYTHRTYVPVETVTFSIADNSVNLDWIPVVDKTYSVEFSISLADWTTIATGISGGTYTDILPVRYAPDAPPLGGFYRVYE
jgi:hypothetical protein